MVHKKKMPVFWRIYIAIIAVFAVALIVWLVFLHGWLADYESAQPKYIAEETFREHFSSFDAAKYVELCKTDANVLETDENIIAYLRSVTDGREITYKKVSSGLDSGYKYIVMSGSGEDEVKFASFKLIETRGEDGEKLYEAGAFEIYTDSKKNVTVEVPENYSVFINGTLLSDSYVTQKDIPTTSCELMPEGVRGLYYTKYAVTGLISEPVVEVRAADGTLAPVEVSENQYKASLIYDSALEAEYSEWILEGAILYARYTQYDSNVNVVGFNKVAPYFDPTSGLYESIRTMENMFVQYYDSFEFVDQSVTEFYRYDENTFSCRVKYTQNMYKGSEKYDDFIDQTYYLRMVDGKYLIYNMYVN
ncbi:MAG: hypothetical protein IJD22_00960 [Clostridia bacterium]|nr:hypothetical protein [Clostridia bacterium]